MGSLAERLCQLRDEALQLPSLSPGHGYDPIGMELSSIVVNSGLDLSEREALFERLCALDSQVISDLQKISVESEKLLEQHHAEKILAVLRSADAGHCQQDGTRLLRSILADYPYQWSGPRLQEEKKLLLSLPGHKKRIIYFGWSMLPFSALEMHVATGLEYDWFDCDEICSSVAKDFIRQMERLGIVKEGAIRIHACRDYADAVSCINQDVKAIFLQDDQTMRHATYEAAAEYGLPIIRSENIGLVKLLYPDWQREEVPASFRKDTLVLARHAMDEPSLFQTIIVPDHNQLYLSLGLYHPA